MLCPKCGRENLDFFKFCSTCGYPLKSNEFIFMEKRDNMSTLSFGLVKMNVFVLFILIIITFGFFWYVWFFMQRPGLNLLKSKYKVNKRGLILLLFFEILGFIPYLSFINIILIFGILGYHFRVYHILKEHFYDKMGIKHPFAGLGTLVFGVLSLQYLINSLT